MTELKEMLRADDEQEAQSIKWNVARIVRLSSGAFALLTHYRGGTLDILKIGTLLEIEPFIPTYEQCVPDPVIPARNQELTGLTDLLADIGLT